MIFQCILLLFFVLNIWVTVSIEDRVMMRKDSAVEKSEILQLKEIASIATLSKQSRAQNLPKKLNQVDKVKKLIQKINMRSAKSFLVKLTQFPERYMTSDNGLKAAQWVHDQISSLKPQVSPKVKLTVKYFKHPWKQPSVIARLESNGDRNFRSTESEDTKAVVIAGSHIDTNSVDVNTRVQMPPPFPNPAADDCASGSSVIFETLRLLVTENFIPKRPIEFHWYAAEEIKDSNGISCQGSRAIAADYAKRNITVVSYLNLDQSGYVKPGTLPQIGIMTDYVTLAATAFLRLTVKEYTSLPTVDLQCQYPCTDNYSWYINGFNSALAIESGMDNIFPYNDQVNSNGSPLDTLDVIDFNHVKEFIKNTIGFVVELSLAD